MRVEETKLKGCYILKPQIFNDERGYFFESFNEKSFENFLDLNIHFVQDNQSYSKKGVLRGLHAQHGEYAQAKLVWVNKGSVIDIAVDVRPESNTFGQYVAVELSEDNNLQLFIPRGFLHGFVVLSESASFFYKCDNYYFKDAEIGVKYDDKDLNIDWKVSPENLIVSRKDLVLPNFMDFVKYMI